MNRKQTIINFFLLFFYYFLIITLIILPKFLNLTTYLIVLVIGIIILFFIVYISFGKKQKALWKTNKICPNCGKKIKNLTEFQCCEFGYSYCSAKCATEYVNENYKEEE